jgi:hypothetical protein
MNKYHKTALEIWTLFHQFPGSISLICGKLRRNDSSKLSRQINPNDDRRDNPYIEILEIHEAMEQDNPALEDAIWSIVERERSLFKKGQGFNRSRVAEQINRVYDEFGDVLKKHTVGAPADELIKETFELTQAAGDLYESVKSVELSREEIEALYLESSR